MKDKEYIKTYKPFIAWLIVFPILSIIIGKLLSNQPVKINMLAILIFMVISLYILMLIMYKGEYVYWITGGPSYEESKLAGSKKRKEYAKVYLDIFFKMMLISLFYGMVSLLLKFSMWIDLIIVSLIIIRSTISTIPIKFNLEK